MNKKEIDEAHSQHKDDLPSVEKEEDSKLDNLTPNDLIPEALRKHQGIVGNIKVLIKPSDRGISYVIADQANASLRKSINGFEYFDEDELSRYPELRTAKNTYARPLIHGNLYEMSSDMLFCGMFETNPILRGSGLGVAFQENLADLAENLKYKFITGHQNNAQVANFFLKRGRYLVEEIKDELQGEFQGLIRDGADDELFYTVKFANPDDVERYIKKERIDTSVEDKIEFKEKINALHKIFDNLSKLLKKVEKKEDGVGDRATLIEIMEDLNNLLPEKDQYNLPELSEDDDRIVLTLKVLFEHLKSKTSELVRMATLEKLEENIISENE